MPGSVTVPRAVLTRRSIFPYASQLTGPPSFRWGETATSSLVPGTRSHWDLGGLDRCQKLESDSRSRKRRMGVLHPCVNRQKSSHSPESRFLSYTYELTPIIQLGGVVHPSEGLGDGTHVPQATLHFSTWQHSILLWYMALPLQHTWPIPFLKEETEEEFSLPAPTAAIVRGGASTARSVL